MLTTTVFPSPLGLIAFSLLFACFYSSEHHGRRETFTTCSLEPWNSVPELCLRGEPGHSVTDDSPHSPPLKQTVPGFFLQDATPLGSSASYQVCRTGRRVRLPRLTRQLTSCYQASGWSTDPPVDGVNLSARSMASADLRAGINHTRSFSWEGTGKAIVRRQLALLSTGPTHVLVICYLNRQRCRSILWH